MTVASLRLDSPGFGVSLQDRGRFGWRRFGVPCSGWMDDHAARWANRLLDNPLNAVVLEIQFQGVELTVLENTWMAITGGDLGCNVGMWRVVHLKEGQILSFRQSRVGLWAYLAVEGGFEAESLLGSRSAYPRGHIGRVLGATDVLARNVQRSFQLPPGVASRTAPWPEHRNYNKPPHLRVWPGPQWEMFPEGDRELFFKSDWTVTS